MKKYSILDIHDSLRTNLGADFDVEAPMFVDNYVNNENFRAASHEAMTKLDPEFTTQAIEHNEDTLKKKGGVYESYQNVGDGQPNGLQRLLSIPKQLKAKRFKKKKMDWWDAQLSNDSILDKSFYDLGSQYDVDFRNFRNLDREQYYKGENEEFNQTLKVERTQNAYADLLAYGQARFFGSGVDEKYGDLTIFGKELKNRVDVIQAFNKAVAAANETGYVSDLLAMYEELSPFINEQPQNVGEFIEKLPEIQENLNNLEFGVLPTIDVGPEGVSQSNEGLYFRGSVQEAIDVYNKNMMESPDFKSYENFMNLLTKADAELEVLEEENPLYFAGVRKRAEVQANIDNLAKKKGFFNSYFVRPLGWLSSKATDLAQGAVSIIAALEDGFGDGGYNRFDEAADATIEFLDKDNYTFTGTASKFQGSMTEYIVDVEVDGETYYAVYADKNGKSLSYVRDADGFMVPSGSSLVNEVAKEAKGKQPTKMTNSAVEAQQYVNTIFDVATMIGTGYAFAATKLGTKSGLAMLRARNRVNNLVMRTDNAFKVTKESVDQAKRLSTRLGAEMTMAAQMHNDIYQGAREAGLTDRQAAFTSLGHTAAIVMVNRLNPEYDMFRRMGNKVRNFEVKALLTKKGFTNVDLWKSGFSNMNSLMKSGVGEAFEEGMFEPFGQDLFSVFQEQAFGVRTPFQSFTEESVKGMEMGFTIGLILPGVNLIRQASSPSNLTKDVLYRMSQDMDFAKERIESFEGMEYLDENGEVAVVSKEQTQTLFNLVKGASDETEAYRVKVQAEEGRELDENEMVAVMAYQTGLAALQLQKGNVPESLQPLVDESINTIVTALKNSKGLADSVVNPMESDPVNAEENFRNEDDMRSSLEGLGRPTQRSTNPQMRALAAKLEKHFPGTSIVTSQVEFDKALNSIPEAELAAENRENVMGWYDGDQDIVYINPKADLGKPIHEFTHVWLGYVKKHNPDLYKRMEELAMESPEIMGLVPQLQEYTGDKSVFVNEALTRAIEQRGKLAIEDQGVLDKFLKMVKEMYDYLRATLKISDKPFEEVTLDEFINQGAYEVLTGDFTFGAAAKTMQDLEGKRVKIDGDVEGMLELINGTYFVRDASGNVTAVADETQSKQPARAFSLTALDVDVKRSEDGSTINIDGTDYDATQAEPITARQFAITATMEDLNRAVSLGYLVHGTTNENFRSSEIGPYLRQGQYGRGFYFTAHPPKSMDYGGRFVFLNNQNSDGNPIFEMISNQLTLKEAFELQKSKGLASDGLLDREPMLRHLIEGDFDAATELIKAKLESLPQGLGNFNFLKNEDGTYNFDTIKQWAFSEFIGGYSSVSERYEYASESIADMKLQYLQFRIDHWGNIFDSDMGFLNSLLLEMGVDGYNIQGMGIDYYEAVIWNNEKIKQHLTDDPRFILSGEAIQDMLYREVDRSGSYDAPSGFAEGFAKKLDALRLSPRGKKRLSILLSELLDKEFSDREMNIPSEAANELRSKNERIPFKPGNQISNEELFDFIIGRKSFPEQTTTYEPEPIVMKETRMMLEQEEGMTAAEALETMDKIFPGYSEKYFTPKEVTRYRNPLTGSYHTSEQLARESVALLPTHIKQIFEFFRDNDLADGLTSITDQRSTIVGYSGLFQYGIPGKTIVNRRNYGINADYIATTILHEHIHALTTEVMDGQDSMILGNLLSFVKGAYAISNPEQIVKKLPEAFRIAAETYGYEIRALDESSPEIVTIEIKGIDQNSYDGIELVENAVEDAYYGFSNQDELLAEAFSNIEFQQFLASTPVPESLLMRLGFLTDTVGMKNSMWETLIAFILKTFSKHIPKMKGGEITALEAVLRTASKPIAKGYTRYDYDMFYKVYEAFQYGTSSFEADAKVEEIYDEFGIDIIEMVGGYSDMSKRRATSKRSSEGRVKDARWYHKFAMDNLKESRQMANQYGVKIPFINLSGDNDVFDPRFPARLKTKFNNRSFSIEEPAGKKAMAALQDKININPQEAVKIGIAPFTSTQATNPTELIEQFETEQFKYFEGAIEKVAGLLGIEGGIISRGQGGYVSSTMDVKEATLFFEGPMNPAEAKVMTAVLGALAPERQESVMRFTPSHVPLDPMSEDTALEFRVPMEISSDDGAYTAMVANMNSFGVESFTILPDENLVVLYGIDGNQLNNIANFVESLDQGVRDNVSVTTGKLNFDEESKSINSAEGHLAALREFGANNPNLSSESPELYNYIAFAETFYTRQLGFETNNPELIATPLDVEFDSELQDFRIGRLPLSEYGAKYGVKNLGGVRPLVPVAMGPKTTWDIPGGLEGDTFTFAELFYMKQQGWNPAHITNEKNRTKLYQKLARTMKPEANDQVDIFNRFMLGLLSSNQPLTPNEFQVAAGRVQAISHPESDEKIRKFFAGEISELTAQDIEVLSIQGYANMMVGLEQGMTQKELDKKIGIFLGTQAGSQGGLGIRGSANYVFVAELASKFVMDSTIKGQEKGAEFFFKKEDETWISFVTRIMSEVRGLSAKTASFSVVWQDPLEAMVSAIDRHMLKIFENELLSNTETRTQFEGKLLKMWNDAVAKRDKLKGKARLKYLDGHNFLNKNSVKAANVDEVLSQGGGKAAMTSALFNLVTQKSAVYKNSKGEINPRYEAAVGKHTELLSNPDKINLPGDKYIEAMTINQRLAEEAGLNIFMSQWALWDVRRNRFEPHEVMFPGLYKLPRLPFFNLKGALDAHKAAGYFDSSKDANDLMSSGRAMSNKGLYFSIDPEGNTDKVKIRQVVDDAIKKGMNPVRIKEILVESGLTPETAANLVELGFADSLMDPKKRLTARVLTALDAETQEAIDEKALQYFPKSNTITTAEAKILIDELGVSQAIALVINPEKSDFYFLERAVGGTDNIASRRKKGGRPTKGANTVDFRYSAVRVGMFNELMQRLEGMIKELDGQGNTEAVEATRVLIGEMVESMAADATSAGQFIQAFSMLVGTGGEALATYVKRKLTKAGMPPLTEEQEERLLDITGRLRDLPKDSTAERTKAELELMKLISEQQQVSLFDIVEAQYYANLLSGVGTQIKNISAGVQSILTEGLVIMFSGDFKAARAYYQGLFNGFGSAKDAFTFTAKTGARYESGRGGNKFEVRPGASLPLYETMQSKGLIVPFKSSNENKYINAIESAVGTMLLSLYRPSFMKLPGRLLSAFDIGIQTLTKEGEIAVIMNRLARGKDTDAMSQADLKNLEKEARDILLGLETQEEKEARTNKYAAQALQEGFEENTLEYRMRIREMALRDETRDDIQKEAERVATESIFTNEPSGILGAGYRMVVDALGAADFEAKTTKYGLRLGKALFVPFLRVLANVGNRLYAYTPMQYANLVINGNKIGYKEGDVLRGKDAQNRAWARANFGTAMLGYLLLGMQPGDDDELPAWEITANGFGDRNKNYQLADNGKWEAYTITLNRPFPGGPLFDTPKRFNYQESPLVMVLAGLGTISDYDKYVKGDRDENTLKNAMVNVQLFASATILALSDFTFIGGLQELFKGIPESGSQAGQVSQNAIVDFFNGKVASTGKALTIPNFIQQINRSVLDMQDKPINQRLDWLSNYERELLFLSHETDSPLVDVLGDEVQPDISRYFSFISANEEVSDSARDYFYETFIMNGVTIGSAQYPGVINELGEVEPYDEIQKYKFYVLRGAMIKKYMYELSNTGIYDDVNALVENAVQEKQSGYSTGRSDGGSSLLDIDKMVQDRRTDLLKKVLSAVTTQANEFAAAYTQAEYMNNQEALEVLMPIVNDILAGKEVINNFK